MKWSLICLLCFSSNSFASCIANYNVFVEDVNLRTALSKTIGARHVFHQLDWKSKSRPRALEAPFLVCGNADGMVYKIAAVVEEEAGECWVRRVSCEAKVTVSYGSTNIIKDDGLVSCADRTYSQFCGDL